MEEGNGILFLNSSTSHLLTFVHLLVELYQMACEHRRPRSESTATAHSFLPLLSVSPSTHLATLEVAGPK